MQGHTGKYYKNNQGSANYQIDHVLRVSSHIEMYSQIRDVFTIQAIRDGEIRFNYTQYNKPH
jgi:hypothetical protein